MNKLSTVAVLSLAVLLTGCDSEPSSSEIQKAMQDNIEHTNHQARQRFGENSKDMLTTLNKAEKVSCKESEAKGTYLCKVNTDITLPFMGEKQTIAEFKFTKVNSVWRVI
ncbi:hypothetical protein AB9Q52_019445 [Pantoea vagans]|uniref:hypothetical protein n=1 Tax=Pantoea vagans TaxID=470934 RepID=UPI0035125817